MTPEEFISTVYTAAVASAAKTKVPASFIIAQGALESGWGNHAPGNNLFGIKADTSWNGPVTTKVTREYIDGTWQTETDTFRAYPDWQGCMDDHAQFFITNPRYAGCFAFTDGPCFTNAVAAAGYATDPNYATTINEIIIEHNLSQFDNVSTSS